MVKDFKHSVTLVSTGEVAKDTVAIRFTKPYGFVFAPGQYVALQLAHANLAGQKDYRYLSMASSPSADYLEFVVRMRSSAYKDVLRALPVGAEARLTDAAGVLPVSRAAGGPVVWYAGGVGIAPFISALREYALQGVIVSHITLFSVNHTDADAPYAAELSELALQLGFQFVRVLTRADSAEWSGVSGRLTASALTQFVRSPESAMHCIVGSHGFIQATKAILADVRVPAVQISHEVFCGYCDWHDRSVCCCTMLKECCA